MKPREAIGKKVVKFSYLAEGAAFRQVLYDGERSGAALKRIDADWQIAAAADRLPLGNSGGTVLIADRPTDFSDELRTAVAQNFLRVIHLTDSDGVQEAAETLPIFASIFLAIRVRCR